MPYYALQIKGATVRLVQGFHLPAQARLYAIRTIADLADQSELKVAVGAELPLENIATAHEAVEHGKPIGSMVLRID